jgi:hypothetical protein
MFQDHADKQANLLVVHFWCKSGQPINLLERCIDCRGGGKVLGAQYIISVVGEHAQKMVVYTATAQLQE